MISLTGCGKEDYTSFKEYTDIVTNASETQRNIFVFTSASCAHCQKVLPYINRYIEEKRKQEKSKKRKPTFIIEIL